ncbi:hypothetical protein CL55_00008240 [Polynucleobacter duraquae]|uniref:Uncharacterized protein n=1 Tax=Polynucleobacter duraquae TaxID=1835254 RepID=A0A0E3ZL42_9BURK|nr:HNH endonuclease [Polynucleobacter duraquae]AKD25157.1 hypothetical protein CL55_00008240 [Polynucleobacter duraquae]
MANANLKQNVDEFKVHNNAWFFHYDGIEVMVMKLPDFDYWAGVDGHIYSVKSGAIKRLKPSDNGIGYLKIRLSTKGTTKSHYIHRLIASAWYENADEDRMGNSRDEINHIDGDKSNNKLCNLERCSKAENAQHLSRVLKAEDFIISKRQRLSI